MLSYIPLIVILAGLIAMAIVIILKKKKGSQSREAYFKSLGWQYHNGSSVHVIGDDLKKSTLNFKVSSETGGVSWSIFSYLYLQIDNVTNKPFTIFMAETSCMGNGRCILIPSFKNQSGYMGGKDILNNIPGIDSNFILRKIGIDTPLLSGLNVYETSDEIIKNNYHIYATGNNAFRQALSGKNEEAIGTYIMSLKNPAMIPFISFNPENLEVRISHMLEKPDEIKRLADLGISLIENTPALNKN